MKKIWMTALLMLLLLSLLCTACSTGDSGKRLAEQLSPFASRLDTGSAFYRAAENNPLDRALTNEVRSDAGSTDEGLLEILLRYGDYWLDEMENARRLVSAVANEEQRQAVENEQESFLLHMGDQLNAMPLLTDNGRLSDIERSLIEAQARLNGYRLRALELYEYHHLLTLGYGVQGEVRIGFLFQEEDVL